MSEAIADYFTDAAGFFAFGEEGYYENHSFFVALVLCFLPAVPALFLYGRLRGASALGVPAGLFFLLELWYGIDYFFPELCAVASSTIAVSAASFARKREAGRRQDEYTGLMARAVAEKSRDREPGIQAGSGQASETLTFALLATILISMFLPRSAYGFHIMGVESFVDDFVDLFSVQIGYSRARTVFSLGDFGYGDLLGGPVSLRDDPVFIVAAESPALLRASVKDIYTGYSWEKSSDVTEYRFDSSLASGARAKAFGEGLPEGTGPNARDGRFSADSGMAVTLVGAQWRSELLTAGRPYAFESVNIYEFTPYFDTQGQVFSKRALIKGLGYIVYEELLDFTSTRFTEAVIEYEELVRADKAAGYIHDQWYAEIVERYTNLPGIIDDSVLDFARFTTEGITSPYLKVLALRESLSVRSTYTLSPPVIPANREFISWFMETRQGYCTYYATALTVFARSLGVPARYVEGFTTFRLPEEEEGIYIITGEQAHAWCEVYIEGVGWIPVDATISYAGIEETARDADYAAYAGSDRPLREPEFPWEDYFDAEGGFGGFDEADTGGFKLPAGSGYFLLAMLLLLPVFGVFLVMQMMRRSFDLSWIQQRMDPEGILLLYWRDMLRMLPRLGLRTVTGETPRRMVTRLITIAESREDVVISDPAGFMEIAAAVEDCVYGSVEPDNFTLLRLSDMRSAMDKALLKLLKPHGYFLTRLRWRRAEGRE
jgi:transglutaminase-like putative cysteine protease